MSKKKSNPLIVFLRSTGRAVRIEPDDVVGKWKAKEEWEPYKRLGSGRALETMQLCLFSLRGGKWLLTFRREQENKIQGEYLSPEKAAEWLVLQHYEIPPDLMTCIQPATSLEQSKVHLSRGETEGSSETGEKKRTIPKDEAEIMVREFLKKYPEATARDTSKGTGVSMGQLPKLASWRAEMAKRNAAKDPKKRKTQRMTKKMALALHKGDDPAAIVAVREIAERKIVENLTEEERAQFFAKPKQERDEMIEAVVSQLAEEVLEAEENDDSA